MHVNNYGRHLFNTVSHGNFFKMTFSMDVPTLSIAKIACFRLHLKNYSIIIIFILP